MCVNNYPETTSTDKNDITHNLRFILKIAFYDNDGTLLRKRKLISLQFTPPFSKIILSLSTQWVPVRRDDFLYRGNYLEYSYSREDLLSFNAVLLLGKDRKHLQKSSQDDAMISLSQSIP